MVSGEDADKLERRVALKRLGLGVAVAYVAPTVLHLDRTAQAVQPSCNGKQSKGNPWCSKGGKSGKGGKGTKRKQGDSKTPQGVYRVSKFKDSSRFHYFIQLDYPNLIDAWYGYKNKTIDANDFKRIASAYKNREAPPQDTALGGFIGIHGLGEENEEKLTIHQEINWTEGCIALTNAEVIDLKKFIDIGTPVIIKE